VIQRTVIQYFVPSRIAKISFEWLAF